jgi:DNA mismatch endonuclease (patch repair protein)
MSFKKNYIRDKRSPKPKNDTISRVMSANKAKNTKPEMLLRSALWKAGLRGYRVHNKNLPGRPDISFTTKKIALFVNGCFWHRCPYCSYSLPKHNSNFWKDKFDKNIARDKRKVKELEDNGWRVITIWECKVNKNVTPYIKTVKAACK